MANFLKYKLDYLLVVLLSIPILFLKLGSFSLRLWDESIYATNSIEMMERGEWIVPYFNGEMDYWNTKPPMINWLQIISMKIFGINEFAIRFPSAVAGLFTVLIIFWFLKKHFGRLTGMAGALVLLTSVGFVTFHGARTGDTDVLLTLFMTSINILFLDAILQNSLTRKNTILIALSFLAGFLTKSIAVFLFLPPIIFYLVVYKRQLFLEIIRMREVYLSLIAFIILVLSYVLWRNNLQPGYLQTIFTSEMGRTVTDFGKHSEPLTFYLDNLVSHRYMYWIIFAVASFLILFDNKLEQMERKALSYIALLSGFYLALISFSVTKLAWYDIPLFPIWAISIAILLQKVFDRFAFSFKTAVFSVLILFFLPYKHVFGLSQTNHFVAFEQKNEVRERFLFNYYFSAPREILKGKTQSRMVVYNNRYDRALLFYRSKFKHTQLDLIISDHPELKSGDMFVIEKELLTDSIFPASRLVLKDRFENLNIYKVK